MDLTPIEKYFLTFRKGKWKTKSEYDPEFRYVMRGWSKVPKARQKFKAEDMTLGDVAYLLRRRSGKTLRFLAEHLQVSYSTVQERENNPKYFGRTHHNLIALSNWMTQAEADWVVEKYGLNVKLEGRDSYVPPSEY